MDVTTDPLKMGMGGVALMADAPSATIWGVIALPKRVASVGVIVLTKFIAAQQVAPTCPKRMEFARYMVEHEFAKFRMYSAFISVQNVQKSLQKLDRLHCNQ